MNFWAPNNESAKPKEKPQPKEEPKRRSPKQIKRCAEWLAFCVRIGWRKDQLDALENLWWKYHGGNDEQA